MCFKVCTLKINSLKTSSIYFAPLQYLLKKQNCFLCWLHLIQTPGQHVLRKPLMESQESEGSAIAENTTNYLFLTYKLCATLLGYHYREDSVFTFIRSLIGFLYHRGHLTSHQQSKGRNERKGAHVYATIKIRTKRLGLSTLELIIYLRTQNVLSPSSQSSPPSIFWEDFDVFWSVLVRMQHISNISGKIYWTV